MDITSQTDVEDIPYWKCPHCGHDESWFDRSIYYWQDKDGKSHEEGPFTRCCSCGKADEPTKLEY